MATSDLLLSYQKQIEEALELVKFQKIPAGDWQGADNILKECLQMVMLVEQKLRVKTDLTLSQHRDTGATKLAVKSLHKEIDSLVAEVNRNLLLRNFSRGSLTEDDPENGLLESEQEILKRTGNNLRHANDTLIQIHKEAIGIQENLEAQRETLNSIHQKVGLTNRILIAGRNVIRKLETATIKGKVCAYAAVVAVMTGIVVAIYWVLFRV
jgi:hypothetical protein